MYPEVMRVMGRENRSRGQPVLVDAFVENFLSFCGFFSFVRSSRVTGFVCALVVVMFSLHILWLYPGIRLYA